MHELPLSRVLQNRASGVRNSRKPGQLTIILGESCLLFCHRLDIGPDFSLVKLLGFRLLYVTDARQEEAALEEVVEHLQEALRYIRSALEVLSLAEMAEPSDVDDLF